MELTEEKKIELANKYAESKRSSPDDFDSHYTNDFEGFLAGIELILSRPSTEVNLESIGKGLRWFYTRGGEDVIKFAVNNDADMTNEKLESLFDEAISDYCEKVLNKN